MPASEERFWELAAPLDNDPAVRRSTMMGLPCLRHGQRFFASFDRRTHALVIKLDRRRVAELVDDGTGQPFASAGRVFREWVAIPDTPALAHPARGGTRLRRRPTATAPSAVRTGSRP